MVGGHKKLHRSCYGEGADRISSLPDNVMEHILSFLPLREAVKTSLLSSKWRNKWTYLPALVFDDSFCKPRMRTPYDCVLFDVLYVLKLHRGPVRELSLSIPQPQSCLPRQLDQILHALDTAHIESLSIDIKDYILPRCVFSFGRLRKLQLCSCRWTPSVIAFDSFPLLAVLELRAVTLVQDVQVSFNYNCPLLSELTMDKCGNHTNKISIVIEAPSLDSFSIVGSFNWLDFKHTPILKRVSIHQDYSVFRNNHRECDYFCKIMNGLPAMEQLTVSGYFYDYLLIGSNETKAKEGILTHLTLGEMSLNSGNYIWSAISLLNHCKDLEQLILNMKGVESTPRTVEYCSGFLSKNVVYRRLKRVTVSQVCGTVLETTIIRWLLASLPKLEKMKIEFPSDLRAEHQTPILKQLIELPRASPTAEIIVN